jgi:phenylalanyl-tRNA synthetase beta chain
MCGLLVGPGDHARAGLAEDGITAVDPLVREESVLRTSLLPGLLRTVEFNADRRNTDFGMFEIGHVFRRPAGTSASSAGTSASSPELPELPDEREVLGVVLAGMGVDGVGSGAAGAVSALRRIEGALRLADVDVKVASAPGLHPGRAAAVVIDGIPAGSVGQIDPEVASAWNIEAELGWFEVDLGIVAGAARRSEAAQPVSRFPSSDIDLAFVVADTTPASAVEATLRHAAGELLERITLFDVYRGGPSGAGVDRGHRSLAFRLRFCALDHTLTDAELADVRERCIAAVSRAHPARLRG